MLFSFIQRILLLYIFIEDSERITLHKNEVFH